MQNSKNTIIVGLLSLVAIFGFLAIVYLATNTTSSEDTTVYTQINTISKTDHVKWAKNSKNILVEYSDLQCPACKVFHDNMKTLFEASGSANPEVMKNIAFVYRHYPLYNVHPFAEKAAFSAEAAANQGKFFEMSDLMFTNQDTWAKSKDPAPIFEGYAKDLKLDIDQFKKDRDSKEVKDRVSADVVSGNGGKLNATPTFFLNGTKVAVASVEEFKKLLVETAKK